LQEKGLVSKEEPVSEKAVEVVAEASEEKPAPKKAKAKKE
jgi:hypothetical protein